jgi:putative transposase
MICLVSDLRTPNWIVFWLEFFAPIPPAGRSEEHESFEVSDARKAFILKQGNDGIPVADICRSAGISQATYFNWKKKYDGLLPTEMRRLRQQEDENAKLRRVVADLSLDKEMLQDAIHRNVWSAPSVQGF